MKKPVLIEGQEITLATMTIGDLEAIDLTGKTGRKWNIAMIAASIAASGDTEHGTEAWVKAREAFDPEGEDSEFDLLLDAMNTVNGFKRRAEKNAQARLAAAPEPAEET